MLIFEWRSREGVEERPFMAAFHAIMITGELQLVSFGFEAAGAKAPFIPTPYAALKSAALPRKPPLGLFSQASQSSRFRCRRRPPSTCPVHQLAGHDRFRHALFADIRNPLHPDSGPPRIFSPRFNFNFNPQLVSGNDGSPKTRAFDSGEHHQLMLTVWNLGKQQRSARLRNRLNNQHPGHDRQARKMSLKKWLVDRNVLDGHNPLLALEVKHPVNQ